MNLEEELKMVTNSVPVQQESTPVVNTVATPIQVVEEIKQEQLQAQAQVVQPTQTFMQPVQGIQTMQVNQPAQNYVSPMPTQPVQYDLNGEAGVKQIQFGQTINVNPVQFIKMSVGEKLRFTLLEPDVLPLAFHYSEKLGTGTSNGKRIPCWSSENHTGQCCIDLGKPKARYYLPVLVYPTMPNDVNTIIPGAKPTFKVLMTWDDNVYNVISEAAVATNCSVDFIASGKDTFGGIDVRTSANSYRNQFANEIAEGVQNWRRCKSMIPSMIRENMTEDEYKRRIAQIDSMITAAPQNNYSAYNNYNSIY